MTELRMIMPLDIDDVQRDREKMVLEAMEAAQTAARRFSEQHGRIHLAERWPKVTERGSPVKKSALLKTAPPL